VSNQVSSWFQPVDDLAKPLLSSFRGKQQFALRRGLTVKLLNSLVMRSTLARRSTSALAAKAMYAIASRARCRLRRLSISCAAHPMVSSILWGQIMQKVSGTKGVVGGGIAEMIGNPMRHGNSGGAWHVSRT
jgi:hypothetical protein